MQYTHDNVSSAVTVSEQVSSQERVVERSRAPALGYTRMEFLHEKDGGTRSVAPLWRVLGQISSTKGEKWWP